MYDYAHVWIPEKSLVRERYAAVLSHAPRVLFGLSQSWEPSLHVIRHASWVYSVAFSPDGGRLASGSDEIVRIWNTATGELEDELEGHAGWVRSVAFSHNGCFIVSGSDDTSVRIWNATTCETRYMLTGHTHAVTSVAISRNDKFMVSGSYDRTIRLWDTAKGELLRELKDHTDTVKSVAVSPDCQHIASASGNEVWIRSKDGIIEHKLKCPTSWTTEVYDLAFSHDGHRILSSEYRTEWTITGHRLSLLDTVNDLYYLGSIQSVAYSPADDEIVCGMLYGTVMIWNTETNKTHILGGHSGRVTSVSFSPDGSRIASGSSDGIVRIWDPRLKGTFDEEVDLEELNSIALSRDGRWIVTASFCHIQVWRVTETVTKMNQIRGHSGAVTCVAFSYDGSYVVSGSWDNTVRIWACHTGNEVGLYQHSNPVRCVTFSRDGSHVAFGSYDHPVRVWNPSTGDLHSEPDNKSQRRGLVHSVAFSHDGNHVISGWYDRVWIWNVTINESTVLSERIQLPDGTRVHPLSMGDFHVYDPVDQETTNGIPPHLLSISPDRVWITGKQGEHNCWIPPQYRNFIKAHFAESIVCLQFYTGMVVLDLKNTRLAERVMQ